MKKLLLFISLFILSCSHNDKNNTITEDNIVIELNEQIVDEKEPDIVLNDSLIQLRDDLSKLFKVSNDEFSDNVWISPSNEPKYRNQNANYMYFQQYSDGSVGNFRMVYQYESDDWLFIRSLIFNIDGRNFSYDFSFDTDCGNGGRIWEWCDARMNDSEFAEAIENAKSVKVKMIGIQYYDTRNISQKDLVSMQNTIKYYKLLGGKFD